MKTELKPISPTEAGLSIKVISGPRGEVLDNDWPCIGYTLELLNRAGKIIWSGPYFLGVGHAKPYSYDDMDRNLPLMRRAELSQAEQNVSHHWARGTTFKKEASTLKLWADTAAKLAVVQKVAPKLEDVAHSLLSDGAAFFDGMRFEDWAADLGYSSDSIKAKETFETCDRIGRDLARAFSRDELAGLREWASNY